MGELSVMVFTWGTKAMTLLQLCCSEPTLRFRGFVTGMPLHRSTRLVRVFTFCVRKRQRS